jgi:hypothetical protein
MSTTLLWSYWRLIAFAQLLELAAILPSRGTRARTRAPLSSQRLIPGMALSQPHRMVPLRAIALLLASAVALAGCSTMGDQLPTAAGGLPEGAPQRPAAPTEYPAVHDLPPPRTDTMLSADEQKKLEQDLAAARDRAAGAAAAKPAGSARSP